MIINNSLTKSKKYAGLWIICLPILLFYGILQAEADPETIS